MKTFFSFKNMIKIKKKVSAKVSSGNFKNFDEVYIFLALVLMDEQYFT